MAAFVFQSMFKCRSFSVFPRCPLLCAIQKGRAVPKKDDDFTVEEEPKKPPTTFNMFCKKNFDSVKQRYPQSQLQGIFSSLWKNLPESEKQKYLLEYKAQYEKYIESMYQYYQKRKNDPGKSENSLKDNKVIMKALTRKMGKPVKPPPAFTKFLMEYGARTGKNFHVIMKEGKEKWAEMSDTEKEKYITEAKLELDKYREELLLWEKKMVEGGHDLLVRIKSVKKFKNLTPIDPQA